MRQSKPESPLRRARFDVDFTKVSGLSNEAKSKLISLAPESVGQASRITGISPADINVLLIYLEQRRRGMSK